MPRKPKQKIPITVLVNAKAIRVVMHAPTKTRKSWYAYWTGLHYSKSTGQADFDEAVKVVENMLRHGGRRPEIKDACLSDDGFELIQRAHFARKLDPRDKARADKTVKVYLEAINAFGKITGLKPITAATADDCAAFQRRALTMPKNWRQQYPKSKKDVQCLSPNTVLKWSRALQAAFERANRNAGKKCVRGVVDEQKLLTVNPWNQFDWIEGVTKPIRQFDSAELVGFLSYLETGWPSVTVAVALVKTYLWSACRQEEVTSLRWDALRGVGKEHHFEIIGKRGVTRWFRLPEELYHDLQALRTDSPFVFAAYNEQLRRFHQGSNRPRSATMVGVEFKPLCLGDWIYDRLAEWSGKLPKGHAHPHVFRKTALQQAWIGEEETAHRVAEDARVSKEVLTAHYVQVDLWRKSNRTFNRILASLPTDVAQRFGHIEEDRGLREQLKAAIEAHDWTTVSRLSAQLAEKQEPAA